MKFQKMIRIQLMLVGLGAGLLMAKPVFAQQDTDPALFEFSSDSTESDQASLNAALPPAAAVIVTDDSMAQPAVQEDAAAALTAVDLNTILTLMVGIGSIVLLGLAEVVRGSRRRTWKERVSPGFPARAAAN